MKKLKNYSVFEVTGMNYEQLLNSLIKYNIPAINIQRTPKNSLILTVENKNIKKLIAVSSGKCYNINRIKTYGAKAFSDFLKLHLGAIIGTLVCFLLMIINSYFITSVNIQGLQRLNKFEVQQVLKQNKVGAFTLKNSLDIKSLETSLLTTFEDLTIASVSIKGTTLQVNLKEKIYVDILDDISDNIISPCDAKIVSMVVTQGTALYKAGDTVKAGDVIVAGYKLTETGEKSPLKAVASIELDYYLSSKIEVADTTTVLTRTNNSVTFNSFFFNNSLLFNSHYEIPYEFYEQKIEKVKLFNMLPFYMHKCTYYECTPQQQPFNFEENKESLKKQLQYQTYEKISENDIILSENFYITKQQDFNIIVFTLTLRKTIN